MEKLTQQEEEIMQRVWHLGRCTVKEILAELPAPPPPYTTVASVISNLKRKDFVSQQRQGNTYVYAPKVKEERYKRLFMAGFVRDYFSNSFKEMVTFFAKHEKLSPQDLQDILHEIEQSDE